MQKNKFIQVEFIGTTFTTLLSILLNKSYELTNGAAWTIIFASANHSLWEQIKVFFIPYIFWSCLECACLKGILIKRLIVSKIICIYLFIFFNIIFYYVLIMFHINNHINITFYILIFITYIIDYLIYNCKFNLQNYFFISLTLLIIILSAYLTFTAKPLKNKIFKDPISGIYGVLPNKLDLGAIYWSL